VRTQGTQKKKGGATQSRPAQERHTPSAYDVGAV
jgi:hypothetical protein